MGTVLERSLAADFSMECGMLLPLKHSFFMVAARGSRKRYYLHKTKLNPRGAGHLASPEPFILNYIPLLLDELHFSNEVYFHVKRLKTSSESRLYGGLAEPVVDPAVNGKKTT